MRYFMTLSFLGTPFHGWQAQPNAVTVQSTIEDALKTLLRTSITIVGAGRTDAGVHARMMVAHFDAPEEWNINVTDLTYKLNRLLPPAIAIRSIMPVDNELHARFSATSRMYRYYVHTEKDPFAEGRSWFTLYPLDFEVMNKAAEALLQTEDFATFCKTGSDVSTTICHVTTAEWQRLDTTHWAFEIRANRFLRNMVRAIVGTLIEVGRGRMSIEEFRRVIDSRHRSAAGESMPPYALFLEDITY